MDNSNIFNSLTHGQITLNETVAFIKSFLEEQPNAAYSIVIGSDSQERSDNQTDRKSINLVTALVVYRKGSGGKYFWKRYKKTNIYSLREKVYAETLASLEFATNFVPKFQQSLNGKRVDYNLEIHVDVGEYGATKEMIKEVVGMVTGNGFVAKTKPLSFAASNVADKHT